MYTVNGIGTTCYGRAKPIGDTFVATEWVVLLFFPVWPIRCRRMRVLGKDGAFLGWTTRYQIFEQVNFADNLGQVALTWLWTLVPLAVLALPAAVTPGAGPGFFLLAGYFVAAAAFLGFAATRPGTKALSEGWQSVAGLMVLALILYAWPIGSVGPWRLQLATGISYMPEAHFAAGVLLFIALVWCGGVRRLPALGGAVVLAILTSAIDIAFSWGRSQLPGDPSLQPILGLARNALWAASLLLVAGAIVPALRRGSYWLMQLGLPALAWLLSSIAVPFAVALSRNQSPWAWWVMVASPFILAKIAALGLLGSWLRRARS